MMSDARRVLPMIKPDDLVDHARPEDVLELFMSRVKGFATELKDDVPITWPGWLSLLRLSINETLDPLPPDPLLRLRTVSHISTHVHYDGCYGASVPVTSATQAAALRRCSRCLPAVSAVITEHIAWWAREQARQEAFAEVLRVETEAREALGEPWWPGEVAG